MIMIHGDELPWKDVAGHRGGGIQFKILLTGNPGSLDNFQLTLARHQSDFLSPRHRHAFEQIRYVIKGSMDNGGEHRIQTPGTMGYFPEGGYYSQKGIDECDMLVLQFGGPSGNGYPDFETFTAARQELQKQGRFNDGSYHYTRDDGEEEKVDGFQAVWEHLKKRKLVYPNPCYNDIILMQTKNFKWLPSRSNPQVLNKRLGTFSNDSVEVSLLKFETTIDYVAENQTGTRIYYLLSGQGRIKDNNLRSGSAFSFFPGEEAAFTMSGGTELLSVRCGCFV